MKIRPKRLPHAIVSLLPAISTHRRLPQPTRRCPETMAIHVSKAQLASGATVVPGAIAEIVKRHNQGWTKIKE